MSCSPIGLNIQDATATSVTAAWFSWCAPTRASLCHLWYVMETTKPIMSARFRKIKHPFNVLKMSTLSYSTAKKVQKVYTFIWFFFVFLVVYFHSRCVFWKQSATDMRQNLLIKRSIKRPRTTLKYHIYCKRTDQTFTMLFWLFKIADWLVSVCKCALSFKSPSCNSICVKQSGVLYITQVLWRGMRMRPGAVMHDGTYLMSSLPVSDFLIDKEL